MYDDLSRIEAAYGSVAEYYRSRLEESYEDHLRSERYDELVEEIRNADDEIMRWDFVSYETGTSVLHRKMTDKEHLEFVFDDFMYNEPGCDWGGWVDRETGDRKHAKDPDGNIREIRFITSGYKDLFRIPDGGRIQVTYPDHQSVEPCRYVDETHVQVLYSVYHIRQYAEILERNGGKCEPEPECDLDKAVWRLGRETGEDAEYVTVERQGDDLFKCQAMTVSLSKGLCQGPAKWLVAPSMNSARELFLGMTGRDNRPRYAIPMGAFEKMVSAKMKEIRRKNKKRKR